MASGDNEHLPPDPTSRTDDTELPPRKDAAAESTEPGEAFEPLEALEPTDAVPDLTLDFDAASTEPEGEPAAEEPAAEAPAESTPALAETMDFEPSPEIAETLQVPEPVEGSGETAAFEALASEAGETLAAGGSAVALGETAGIEGPASEASGGLGSSIDASTALESEPAEGVTSEVTETQPAAEGGSLPEGLLGSGVVVAGAGAAEEEAVAEGEAAAEEEEEVEKQPGMFARLGAWIADTSVYNVLLFLAVVALVLGSLALVQELQSYNWDIKARDAKLPVAAAGPNYGPPSTTAVA